jgi:hypothetical protein
MAFGYATANRMERKLAQVSFAMVLIEAPA